MNYRCQNCGSTKLHRDGNYYVCDFCGERILKDSLDEIIKQDNKFVEDYIARNEKLFAINLNDDTLTKNDLYQLVDELKQNINEQQDEISKTIKEGILADIFEKISDLTPKKAEPVEEGNDKSDFVSKVKNKCIDLEDLVDKGNALRRRIEDSFFKPMFKNQPLFADIKGKPAITKERYIEFVDSLLDDGKITEYVAQSYKERANSGKLKLISNDSLNRYEADVPIRFLAAGLPFSDIGKACKDWGLLNTCSHKKAEEDPMVKETFLPINSGKEYLINLYNFYKERNIVE